MCQDLRLRPRGHRDWPISYLPLRMNLSCTLVARHEYLHSFSEFISRPTFHNLLVLYGKELFSLPPNPQTRGPPLDGWLLFFIQYIYNYPPYIGIFFSLHNMCTRHVVIWAHNKKVKLCLEGSHICEHSILHFEVRRTCPGISLKLTGHTL
jgi:hypothetical protein